MRYVIPAKALLSALILCALVTPPIVTALSTYLFFVPLGLVNTVVGLAFAHAVSGMPFVVINTAASLRSADINLERAAVIHGAHPLWAVLRITLPIISPGIVIGAIFAFVHSAHELLVAMFVLGGVGKPVAVKIWSGVQATSDPTIAAASAILIGLAILTFASAAATQSLAKRRSRLEECHGRSGETDGRRRGLRAPARGADRDPRARAARAAQGPGPRVRRIGAAGKPARACGRRRRPPSRRSPPSCSAASGRSPPSRRSASRSPSRPASRCVYQDPYTFAKLRAMHEAKAMQIDVVSVQGGEIYQAKRMNMIMPLDFSVIDRSVLSERQLRHGNAIGGHTLSHVICYNKKKWPGEHHPKSWADFWDVQKFPGRRVLRREEVWAIEAALKADGVKDSEFYPLDVARAFRSLDRIKPHIKAWYADNSLAQQLMEQEEVDLIAMMNGRATESILNAKAPFEMVWNEAICEGGNQGWLAPVGCPNPKGAMKFLDFVGRPEYQAVFARLLYYAPQNPKAFDLLEPEIAKLMPTYPENEKVAHIINFDWWGDNLPTMQRRFQQWLQS